MKKTEKEKSHTLSIRPSCFVQWMYDGKGGGGYGWNQPDIEFKLKDLTPHQVAEQVEKYLAKLWDLEKEEWHFRSPNE